MISEQPRRGRPQLPEGQKRRTIGISLSPAALTRIQRLASRLGMSQGEYIEAILEANADVVAAPPTSWKVFTFAPDADTNLRTSDGKALSGFIDEGWKIEQMFPPDINGAIAIALSHVVRVDHGDVAPNGINQSHAEVYKRSSTLPSDWVRQYAANESAVSGIYKSSPHPVAGTISMAHRLDGGPPVPFCDVEWDCGCYGRRYQPGDIVMLLPCDLHRHLVESWRLPASQPFKRKRSVEEKHVVTDSDIIENLTMAISQTYGVPVSRMPKDDTTTTYAVAMSSNTRILKVSDEFIAIAANRGRRITANDSDLQLAFEAVTNAAANEYVILYGDGHVEVKRAG